MRPEDDGTDMELRDEEHGVPGEVIDPDVDLHVPGQRRELDRHQWGVLGIIAAGGAIGAEARYGVGLAMPHADTAFPWSTLVVNASGCLLIALLMITILEVTSPHRLVRPFLGVGVLGGYTTFSTYAVDVQRLLIAGRPATALAYLSLTVVAALAAVWVGAAMVRTGTRLARPERAGSERDDLAEDRAA